MVFGARNCTLVKGVPHHTVFLGGVGWIGVADHFFGGALGQEFLQESSFRPIISSARCCWGKREAVASR